jgi:hypothetical protein
LGSADVARVARAAHHDRDMIESNDGFNFKVLRLGWSSEQLMVILVALSSYHQRATLS